MADEPVQQTRAIPIEWYVPDHIESKYANNLVVQHGENEIIISFFETRPPLILGTPEDIERLARLESIRSECVARIIVSPSKMPAFIEALQTNYQRYVTKKQEAE
jgi:hypothetical protein